MLFSVEETTIGEDDNNSLQQQLPAIQRRHLRSEEPVKEQPYIMDPPIEYQTRRA